MLKVAPVDNLANVREVNERSWNRWDKVPGQPEARYAHGKKVFVVVTDEQVKEAKNPARKPVEVPVEVIEMKAKNEAPAPEQTEPTKAHVNAADMVEQIKKTTTKQEALALAGKDERKTVKDALAAHLEKLA